MSARPALLDCRSHRWGSENWLSRLHFRGQHFTTALTESASKCWVGAFVNGVTILPTAQCLLFAISCTTHKLHCLSLWWPSLWPSLKFFQLLLTQMLRIWCLLYWAGEGPVKPRWTPTYTYSVYIQNLVCSNVNMYQRSFFFFFCLFCMWERPTVALAFLLHFAGVLLCLWLTRRAFSHCWDCSIGEENKQEPATSKKK